MAEKAHALLSVKTKMRDTSDSLLQLTREWPERRKLLREKTRAALGEKVQAMVISLSTKTKAQIKKRSRCKRFIKWSL